MLLCASIVLRLTESIVVLVHVKDSKLKGTAVVCSGGNTVVVVVEAIHVRTCLMIGIVFRSVICVYDNPHWSLVTGH